MVEMGPEESPEAWAEIFHHFGEHRWRGSHITFGRNQNISNFLRMIENSRKS
jgi:hypothetical protein